MNIEDAMNVENAVIYPALCVRCRWTSSVLRVQPVTLRAPCDMCWGTRANLAVPPCELGALGNDIQ